MPTTLIFLGIGWTAAFQAVAVPLTVESFEILNVGGDRVSGWGINNHGDVVGRRNVVFGSGIFEAFAVLGPDLFFPLAGIASSNHGAFAINNARTVVGDASTTGTGIFTSFIWNHPFPPMLIQGIELRDINHNFVTAGTQYPSATELHAYRSSTGAIEQENTSAESINAAGTLAGGFLPLTGVDEGFHFHAFIDRNGVFEDLGTLGGDSAYARDINDFEKIVGGTTNDADGRLHAFLWDQGDVAPLAELPGFIASSAEAINNAGIVVGFSINGGINLNNARATVWIEGQPLDLTALAGISSGVLRTAFDISENGWITGEYLADGKTSAYRLKIDSADVVTWLSNQHTGSFGANQRWDLSHVPDQTDTAVFDSPGNYFVIFLDSETTDKLKIQDGLVNFDLFDTAYTLRGDADGKSLVIGDLLRPSAKLILTGGMGSTLKARKDVIIGGESGAPELAVNDNVWLRVEGGMQVGTRDGVAILSSDDGTITVSGDTQVGLESSVGETGRITLTNTARFIAGRLEIGVLGGGRVLVESASSLVSLEVLLGLEPGSNGLLQVEGVGSELFSAGKVVVGDEGQGVMRVFEGASARMVDLDVSNSLSESSVVVADLGSELNVSGHVSLGDDGNGSLHVLFGGKVTARSMSLGNGFGAGRFGELEVFGDGSEVIITQALEVSPLVGRGEVKVRSGGTLTVGSSTIGHGLGPLGSATANVVISDSQWNINGDLTVAGGGDRATVEAIGDSVVKVLHDLRLGSALITNDGRFTVYDTSSLLVGGDVIVRGASISNLLAVEGGHIACTGEVFLGKDGAFGLFGTGVLSLAPGTFISTPTVHVGAGGQLHGRGRVQGNVLHEGGLISPGRSPGVLTIDGDYTEVGDDGTLLAEVGGTLLGDEYDQLNVTGNVTLAGTLVVRFINGFAPHAGDEFAFLSVGGTQTGAFSQIEIENLAPGFQYNLMADGGGLSLRALNDGVFVPEPATLVLLMFAAAGWCLRRGRDA